MAEKKCAPEEYVSRSGRCCDRCPAGNYVRADCDHTKKTECGCCERGSYTATRNHLRACRMCRQCSASNNQRTVKECMAHKDTVCECLTGFFCYGEPCEHCMPATSCPPGTGVKVPTTGANDTICALCDKGTFSNVSDFQSACQNHTRCQDLGRVLATPGTSTTDAICGNLTCGCSWVLPAGLWLGFVLTILVALGLMCWSAKHKSYKMARSSIPIHEVKKASIITDSLLEPPLPNPASHDPGQKSGLTGGVRLTILTPDDCAVSCSPQDNMDLPATLQTDSSNHHNGTDVPHRSFSEPQEDEWCGT
ncbi:tumor necrosis factor receptor superfamily member 5 [Nerophis lumbriciformis]|uniref:tumor necrosis factor receptor superfamily member 5 n=1 Tax=Nerophis lumbriciformis TaxID=546530 RepID=UPI002AE047F0|nr:tumor necrosis factor receptor superfamily member 5-like [Nerophis lumbriciformis]XP_061803927.1 tumor necrosis factor receptor superfamily member 5-like [Nerophis lumbriciformis]